MPMQAFHECIRDARKRLGFSSAKEFHRKKNSDLSMSYESYANLEAGKYLPPAEKLTHLAEALEITDIKRFIYSYCSNQMPNEMFKSFFAGQGNGATPVILKGDSYIDYREKFHALLHFNRIQSKYELNVEQIAYIETDLVAWDIVNLYISSGDVGFSLQEISEKTDSGLESTRKRVTELLRLGILKQLEDGTYLVTQDAFIIPRKEIADKLRQALIRREMDRCFHDKRNRPYSRFRFMSISPEDRENMEMFIDNFILDSRKFKKEQGGKTHYLHVFFSDRHDLE
jgi:transcriptional regulator with XRE-family HTH domain